MVNGFYVAALCTQRDTYRAGCDRIQAAGALLHRTIIIIWTIHSLYITSDAFVLTRTYT